MSCSLLNRSSSRDLNGQWHFKVDREEVGEIDEWHKGGCVRERHIQVPHCWEIEFDDLRKYHGTAWYEREFLLEGDQTNERNILIFKAVDYLTKVWVNGSLAGEHECGFTPFEFDITPLVHHDRPNTLTLKVTEIEDLAPIPGGKQAWYGGVSGIWQDVLLETRGGIYTSDIFVIPDPDASKAAVQVTIMAPSPAAKEKYACRLTLTSPDRRTFSQQEEIALSESILQDFEFNIDDPILWEMDDPKLYEATVQILGGDGTVVDEASTEFGMRKVEAKGAYICLNDKPVYIIGVTDQPDTPDKNVYLPRYVPPTDNEFRLEIKLAQELGLNLLRKHVRPEYPRYLYWTDRTGMLIWEEPPHYNDPTEDAMRQFKSTLRDMVIRDRNHPSIITWGIFNESWGIKQINESEEQQQFVRELYDMVKDLDPTRPICDNSGGWGHDCGAFPEGSWPTYHHTKTDIYDIHQYLNAPAQHAKVKDWAATIPGGDKPVLASEFGQMNPPDMDKIRQRSGNRLPLWITTPSTHPPGHSHAFHMEEFEERFRTSGLKAVYGDMTTFHEAHAWNNFEGLKYHIEQVRKNPSVCGYFITSFCDAFQEPFGLLDYYREEKVFHTDMGNIQKPDLLFLDCSTFNFWPGEKFTAKVFLSHFSSDDLSDCTVKWHADDLDVQGEIKGVSVPATSVSEIGEVVFDIPEIDAAREARLEITLVRNGLELLSNYSKLYVYPEESRNPQTYTRMNVVAHELDMAARLRTSGYDIVDGFDVGVPLSIATSMDAALIQYVSDGGTALLLQEKPHIYKDLRLAIDRVAFLHGPFYHMTNSHSLFDRIPYANPLQWPFYKVCPDNAAATFDSVDTDDLLCSATGCWIKVHVVTECGTLEDDVALAIGKFSYGKGNILVCTFKLSGEYGNDPVATIMLNDLIQYASNGFEATTALPINSTDSLQSELKDAQERNNEYRVNELKELIKMFASK